MAWFSVIMLVTLVRFILIIKFQWADDRTKEIRRWGQLLIIGLGISGILWGLTAIFLFPIHSVAHQAFIAFVLAGMIAGAVGVFSAVMPVFLAFSIPASVPIFIRFIIIGDELHMAMGSMTMLFVILTFTTAKRINSSTKELVALKETFADQLEERTTELKNVNEQFRQEIEERKQAEQALLFKEDIIKSSSSVIATCDLEGNMTYGNPFFLKMWGFDDPEEFLGRPFWKFWLVEDRLEEIMQALRVEGTWTGEIQAVRKDGTLFDIQVSAATVFDGKGNPIALTSTSIDITDRKRAEEEKLALERQVRHAQKLESLGVLAGGIAHDFNNLLMIILGNADLALDELSPMSPARGNLQEIEKASKRAAELAKQMLAYSGKGRFVVEPIDAGELVGEIAHLLEVSISKKVVLKYNFADNLPTFNGGVTQIRQVIMNLITNASEAIGDKSGVIVLSTGTMDCDRAYLDDVNEVLRACLDEPLPEGVYTYFEVADTGCGMDAETIEKVFDPFFTTKFTGRGLGLSAVLGIVHGHKGALKIYSEVGKGTTFKVLFPANELPDNGFAARRKDESEGKDWRGSGTVLIADDEETVCAVGKQMLERVGFSVLTAPDGCEALKVFREHANEIVCVLLDLTMPNMDGEEAFREMRRLHPGVTVILCSGYNEQDAIQRFAGKGLAGFIQKPYNMAALREKLVDVLAAGKAKTPPVSVMRQMASKLKGLTH
jgi:two-component system cell cycle sensor histidine kinase/response regulator CckA